MKKSNNLLISVSAAWCGPCRRIRSQIESDFGDLKESHYLYLDIENKEQTDEWKDKINLNNIRAVPTFIIYDRDNEQELDRFAGADYSKVRGFFNSINEEDEKG